MADTKPLIEQAYSAFKKRDIDGSLALMTQDVSWPKASEDGKVVGKEEIRAYWTLERVRFTCSNRRGKQRVRLTPLLQYKKKLNATIASAFENAEDMQ